MIEVHAKILAGKVPGNDIDPIVRSLGGNEADGADVRHARNLPDLIAQTQR